MDACGPLMLEARLTSKEEHKANIGWFGGFFNTKNTFAPVFESSQRYL